MYQCTELINIIPKHTPQITRTLDLYTLHIHQHALSDSYVLVTIRAEMKPISHAAYPAILFC